MRVAHTMLVVAAAALVACVVAAGDAAARPVGWKAWLCLPGAANDPCTVPLTTTVVGADGARRTLAVPVPAAPPIDCFYVYPTVSQEVQPNADLRLQPTERDAAIDQAARFSQVCRVYAPLYRQQTGYAGVCPFRGALICVGPGNPELAYRDVLAAWNDYLRHDNHGRGVVLIGHSQGAFVLEQLISEQIERSPAERRLLVSALLLGGDVTVKDGSSEGGTFSRTPACTTRGETDCVVAYSSWSHTPPADARLQEVARPGEHVLCVNPAAVGGGSASITPIFPGFSTEGLAPQGGAYAHLRWVEFPGLYSARCVERGTRAWLLVTRISGRSDRRPSAQEILGPAWGFHAADVNIADANLVALVASQAHSWLAHH